MKPLDRRETLQLLREQLPALKRLGIRSLSLFGSVARDEAGPESDVDLLVDMEPPYTFDRYIRAKFFLEDLLGCQVDLVMADTMKPRALSIARQEAIDVA